MIYNCKLKTLILKVKETTEKPKFFTEPKDVFILAKTIYKNLDDDQEHFTVFFLNARNKITGFKILASGGQDASIVDLKILFRNALLFGSMNIIIVHNHPSGNIEASEADITITQRVKKAGEIIDIKIIDHIIITKTKFYSFKENGLI